MKNIGIIGVGKMGLSHLAIANQTPKIRVKAICDSSKPMLHFFKKNTNFECFSNYKKMIEKSDLDGVMILVPNAFHFDIAKYCIEKRISIFVEKPLTLNYKDSQYLVQLAEKYGVKGQVGYVNRFNLIFNQLKKLLEKNVLGEVSSYINRMTGGVVLKENRGWRNDYSKGGGCLFDYGPHCLDLSTYLFGTDVEVRSSELKRVFSSLVDDIVVTTIVHNNSIIGTNYINWSDSSVRKANNSIEIIGCRGKIIANKQELSIFLNEKNDKLNLDKGWNQVYITDTDTDVNYYLRGEDFSLQLLEFSKLLNGDIEQSSSSLYSASVTDKLLEDIKQYAGELE